MNLAQALREKKRLVGEIARLEKRAKEAAVVTVQTDAAGKETRKETYTETEFTQMMQTLEHLRADLLMLKGSIARANMKVIGGSTGCVQTLIHERGEAKAELAFWESLRGGGGGIDWSIRQGSSVLRLTAGAIDQKVDAIVDRIDHIDSEINELNAKIEI